VCSTVFCGIAMKNLQHRDAAIATSRSSNCAFFYFVGFSLAFFPDNAYFCCAQVSA
jgi:hypothetical protein